MTFQGFRRKSPAATGNAPNYYDAGNESGVRTLARLLYVLCIVAGVWFGYLNVAPYSKAVQFALAGTLDNSLLLLLLKLPLIGAIIAFVSSASHWLIGFVLWAAIQTLETFPIFLKHDRQFMKAMIHAQDSNEKVEIKDGDDPAIKGLKSWFNRFPLQTVTTARNWALAAYAVDFCICLLIYPPVNGGFTRFLYVLASGQMQLVNWGNVAMMIVTLFVIEIIVKIALQLRLISHFYKVSRNLEG